MFISLATPTILEFTVYTDIAWYGYTLLVTDYALGLLFCWLDLQMVEDFMQLLEYYQSGAAVLRGGTSRIFVVILLF